MRTATRTTLAIFAVTIAVSLAGCSSGNGSDAKSSSPKSSSGSNSGSTSSQTKAQACSVLAGSLKDSTSALQSSFASIGTDPTKAIAGLNQFATAFDAGLSKVTNTDVKTVATKADDSLKTMTAIVTEDIKTPNADTTKLQAAVTAFQSDFSEIGTVCK